MRLIEDEHVAAPAPIEQRWSSSSSAPMSPAHSSNLSDIHSWVGIIMYLPTDDAATRAEITAAFERYTFMCEQKLMPKYDAKWHWAKLENSFLPESRGPVIREYLGKYYDVPRFNQVRRTLDPENNLGNVWLNFVLPLTRY
jgi:L-galactono-1,4-lactone dehydrogenase